MSDNQNTPAFNLDHYPHVTVISTEKDSITLKIGLPDGGATRAKRNRNESGKYRPADINHSEATVRRAVFFKEFLKEILPGPDIWSEYHSSYDRNRILGRLFFSVDTNETAKGMRYSGLLTLHDSKESGNPEIKKGPKKYAYYLTGESWEYLEMLSKQLTQEHYKALEEDAKKKVKEKKAAEYREIFH